MHDIVLGSVCIYSVMINVCTYVANVYIFRAQNNMQPDKGHNPEKPCFVRAYLNLYRKNVRLRFW